jgi:glutaredoxin 2
MLQDKLHSLNDSAYQPRFFKFLLANFNTPQVILRYWKCCMKNMSHHMHGTDIHTHTLYSYI